MITGNDLSNRGAGSIFDLPDTATVAPSSVAREWGVHSDTVYRDIRKGALRAFRMPGGRYRIRVGDARTYGRPVE